MSMLRMLSGKSGFRVARVKPHEAELSLSQQIFRVVVIAEGLFPREKTELANRAAQVSPSIILVCGSRADYSVPADGYVAASRGLAGILSEVEAVIAPTLYEISA
jgi:hypothetical protein